MLNWLKKRLWPQIWGTLEQWQEDDGGQSAAALAFYTAFSFFPLVLVLLAALGFVLEKTRWGQEANQDYLLKPIQQHVSPELAAQLNQILEQVKTDAPFNGPLGFLMLLFGAIGIFSQMESVFARIWKAQLPPPDMHWLAIVWRILFARLKAFGVLMMLGLFVVLTFVSSLAASTIAHLTEDGPLGNYPLRTMQFGIGLALNILLFTVTYRLFSPKLLRWREALQGSLAAGLLWEVGRIALTQFLIRGGYTAYGVVGSFIAVMFWFYYAWNVVFFGAEYSQVACRIRRRGAGELPAPMKLGT